MISPKVSCSPILFVECTPTVRFDHGTGIPRVVRNVVQHAIRIGRERGIEVIPIAFSNGAFYPAPTAAKGNLITVTEHDLEPRWRVRAKEWYWAAVRHTGRMFGPGPMRQWWEAPGAHRGLTRTLRSTIGRRGVLPPQFPRAVVPRSKPVSFAPGDTILAAEPTIDDDYYAAFLALRDRGVRTVCIAFDLIPIRHPRYVSASFHGEFRAWVDRVVAGSDIVVAISQVVCEDVADYLARLGDPVRHAKQQLTWFHLGNDLDKADSGGAVRWPIQRIFGRSDSGPVFLMVGWLDPRKNQPFVLDALVQLLREGVRAQLVVIGKRGYSTDAYYARLREDPALARCVRTFHNATDTELAYCYRHADALIYPSTIEGFGLPLVEALAHGTKVFASDIPIFREIGEGFVSFFPLDDPEVLVSKLRHFCVDGQFDAPRPVADFRWPTWHESVARLLDIVLNEHGDAVA